MDYHFTVVFEKEEDGGYHAFCPALKGCHTQGDSWEETSKNIEEAMELYIESLIAHQEPIPKEDIIIKPMRITL
ncbi:MAG: hypothetical protein IEMM0008_0904 [bacterium]|nr:MAG: hypothetical protein IEMM0008_0904 [bacterium]